jgi:hypothetical protein
MGRHSVRRYRPMHSAHGPLYWAVVMWPVMLARASAQRGRARSSWNGAAPVALEALAPAGGPTTTRARAAVADTWRAGEGGIAPTWDEHPGPVALP